MPTVVLSNQPGYARFAGEPVPAAQIAAMLDALEANGWLGDTAAVISGYLPSPEHVAAARSAVERVRRGNSAALYVCDPVFGDEPEGIYLSEATASAIRDELLPLASLATPNRFELSWLAGLPVGDPSRRARRPGPWACPPCSPRRCRPTTTASPTCSSMGNDARLLRAPPPFRPARHRRPAGRDVSRQSAQRRLAGVLARRLRLRRRRQRRRQHEPG